MTDEENNEQACASPPLQELPLVGYYGGKPKRFVIEYDDMSSRCIGNADGSVDNITANLLAARARVGKVDDMYTNSPVSIPIAETCIQSEEELNGLQASPSESSGTTGQATQSRDVSDGRPAKNTSRG